MKLEKAKEVICGLDAASQTRLNAYKSNLSMDRDNCFYDNRVSDVLTCYAKNVEDYESTDMYLRTIKYSGSIYEYSQIKSQLERFSQPNSNSFSWNENFRAAKQEMIDEVRSWKIQTLTYRGNDDIVNAIPRKDTHAGFSYIQTGKREKGQYLENIFLTYMSERSKALVCGSFNKPILVGVRTQASGAFKEQGGRTNMFKSKSRLVSMIDIFQIIGEMEFAVPFQNKLAHVPWYAGGKDDAMIGALLAKGRSEFRYCVTIDYSHFDQSISDWLIREAFDIIKESFSRGGSYFDERLFVVIREDFIHKNFVNGDGTLTESHKGVPSGSMFTQIVDSIVNRLMITSYLKSRKHDMHKMMVMGDDNIIFSRVEVDLVDLSSYLIANFGVTVNPVKCSQSITSISPQFLSRTWTYQGVYREPHLMQSKLCYSERFRDYNGSGLDPNMIVWSYILSFPLGMRELINVDKFINDYKSKGVLLESDVKWMTGLMRYRKLYLAS